MTNGAAAYRKPVGGAGIREWVSRPRLLVLFVALAAYANALGNGYAYDDIRVVVRNPVVTQAQWGEALLGPYWQGARPGSGLYRPVTISSFVAEWHAWQGSPLGFHAVNVVLHALVCLLVLALLSRFLPRTPSVVGALLFAVHPVHVEAVANVVGQAELVSTSAFLLACLLYLDGAYWGPAGRGARLVVLALLYLVGLGAKESAVTLPGVLLLLEAFRPSGRDPRGAGRSDVTGGGTGPGSDPLWIRLRRELPVFVSLAAVLCTYLVVRASVLGTVVGAAPAPVLRGITSTQRVLTALTVWPEYLRLLVFPANLSADYTPAVLMVARSVNPEVVVGAVILLALAGLAWTLRKSTPAVSMGIAWFFVTILPVSNLFFPAGILLAERTLYLPSVGYALIAGALWTKMLHTAGLRTRRAIAVLALVAGLALFLRTVVRNPSWMSSYTVMNTLAMQHPESSTALRNRAAGLDRVGDTKDAARVYDAALSLEPNHYGLNVEVGAFYGRLKEYARADSVLAHAIRISPEEAPAYRFLAEELLRQGRGRDAHTVALRGLAEVGPDRELWDAVSESYVLKGDLAAAVRARRAALGVDPHSAADWDRLGELLSAMGRTVEADSATAKARKVAEERRPPMVETGAAGRPGGTL